MSPRKSKAQLVVRAGLGDVAKIPYEIMMNRDMIYLQGLQKQIML